MDQNKMREKLNQIISKYGTTITFIAKKTQLSKTTISLFLRNERDLKTEEIQSRVIKFIESRIWVNKKKLSKAQYYIEYAL